MAQVKEEAKGKGGSKGGMEFRGLGVMRLEFRMRSGSRVRAENRESRGGKRWFLTFTLVGGGWVRDALGWCFFACGSREKGR